MTGVLVKTTTDISDQLDIRNLSSGIYILTVYSGTQKSVKKLLVQ
jgi:hypothetical protein